MLFSPAGSGFPQLFRAVLLTVLEHKEMEQLSTSWEGVDRYYGRSAA